MFLAPHGSKRERFAQLLVRAIRVWRAEGFRGVFLRLRNRMYFQLFWPRSSAPLVLGRQEVQKLPSVQLWLPSVQFDQPLDLPVTTSPQVSVVIVAANAENTYRCLAALASHASQYEFEVIVVHDDAQERTSNLLANIKGIRTLRNKFSQGFTVSCNLGASAAQGEYLLFLRGDVVLQPGSLDELVKTAFARTDCGLVGAKLISPDGSLWEGGGVLWNNGCMGRPAAGEHPYAPQHSFLRAVDFCTSVVLISKSLFNEVGHFDPAFDAYAEADLALSLQEYGWKIYYQALAQAVSFAQNVSTDDEGDLFVKKWHTRLVNQPPSGSTPKLPKKVLFIDTFTPSPDKSAGSVDAFNHMRILTTLGYQVTFIPAGNFAYTEKYTPDLQRIGIECIYSPYVKSAIEHIKVNGKNYDLVFLVRVNNAANLIDIVHEYCLRAKVVFSTVDLHYLREMRHAELQRSVELMKQAQETRDLELSVIRMADCTLVVSKKEDELLHAEVPDANIFYLPLIIDIPNYQPAPFAERKDIFFIGGFDHRPNVDAVQYFAMHIWPLIRNRIPGVKFYIIGSNAPKEIIKLATTDIVVIGYAEDVSSYFNNCRLSVAPLRYGAGVKGKVGRSLGYGLPVVATDIAAEGTGLLNGQHVLVANEAESFSEAVVRLYQDEYLWRKLSENSLAFFEANFSLEAGLRAFTELVRQLNYRRSNLQSQLLELAEIYSLPHYQAHTQAMIGEYARREQIESHLVGSKDGFETYGDCYVCGKKVLFQSDFSYAIPDASGRLAPNWRERLVCPECGLNSRMRAAIHVFEQTCRPRLDSAIYLTEQVTPLFDWFRRSYRSVIGSEFLENKVPYGHIDENGLRNETLTRLTFADEQFDYILSFDVFEHISDHEPAFQECLRCLKPGGALFFSIPFQRNAERNVVRAQSTPDGRVKHLLPPEYHGNPLDSAGSLCFHDFGWELLEQIRSLGFASATTYFFWSLEFGYLGREQMLFMARKGESGRTRVRESNL